MTPVSERNRPVYAPPDRQFNPISRNPEHQWLAKVFTGIFLIYCFLVIFPLLPGPLGVGLDASWMIGLNRAHAQGLVAGKTLVFSYGPLGYLLSPEPGAISPLYPLVFALALYSITVLAMARLVQICRFRSASLWSVFFMTASMALDRNNDRVVVLIALSLVCYCHSRWRYAEVAVLGIVASAVLLMKFNEGVEGMALFTLALTTIVARDWPLSLHTKLAALAAAAAVPISTIVLFWAVTGSISALPDFISHSFNFANGYSEGMSFSGLALQVGLAVCSIALLVACVLFLTDRPRDLLPGVVPALLAAFFAFKWAIVRQDNFHAGRVEIRIALAAVFLLICASTARDRRLILVLQLFLVAVNLSIVLDQASNSVPITASPTAIQPPVTGEDRYAPSRTYVEGRMNRVLKPLDHVRAYFHWFSNWEEVRRADAGWLASVRLDDPQFQNIIGNGSVDAMLSEIDRVVANGWRWQPRPVFQSYSDFTPELDQLNARYLAAQGADYLLMSFNAIDERHPFFEQPLNWIAALHHYRFAWEGSQFVLLGRKPVVSESSPTLAGHSTASWGQKLRLPEFSGDLLLMHPHFKLSFAGQAAKTLFRVAPVYITATFRSGRVFRWRVVPSTAAAGIIVAPFPLDLRDAAALFRGELRSRDQIEAIEFDADVPAEFRSLIEVDWSTLKLPRDADAHSAEFDVKSLERLWSPGNDPLPNLGNTSAALREGVLVAQPESANPQLSFRIPNLGRYRTIVVRAQYQRADRVRVSFGKRIDGRELSGNVLDTNHWVDIYVNVSHNPYWAREHGDLLRIEPGQLARADSEVKIAGIYGSAAEVPLEKAEIVVLNSPAGTVTPPLKNSRARQ